MTDDAELLRQYVQVGSEDAFAELVQRHLPVVYSSALRQTDGDVELAKDICQTVFIDLARKAGSLLGHELLIGWLFSATRFAAATVLRSNRRRQIRERIAVSMREDAATPALECRDPKLASALDAALAELTSEDRNAVLLRFFQGKDFKDVATALGISDDAARMRVTRAIGKLHSLLESRGVTVSAAALGSILATEAVTAVPAGLAATISAAAFAGTPLTTTAAATVAKAMAMTTLNKTLITATVAVLAGVGIYEARQAANASAQAQKIEEQQTPLTEQIRQLQLDRDNLATKLDALKGENERLNRNTDELLKLRSEIGRLRTVARAAQQANTAQSSTDATAGQWAARANLLKQYVEQYPTERIPEFQFVTDHDWFTAGDGSFENGSATQDDYRRALESLRFQAESQFGVLVRRALNKYCSANNRQFPNQLSDLQQFCEPAAMEILLQLYEIRSADVLPENLLKNVGHLKTDRFITRKEPVNAKSKTRYANFIDTCATWESPV
jgi:RNA polymerase sigma factor (sigma-70 family)